MIDTLFYTPMPTNKAPKKLNLKTRLFIQYLTDTEQLDKEGKHTFGNQKRAYDLAYGRQADNTATVKGSNLVSKGNVQSELEVLANQLDIGIKVRMGTLQGMAKKRGVHKVKSRQYSYVDDPDNKGKRKRVLVSSSETDTPTTDRDSIRAIQVINKMTGLDAMQAGVKELAIREAKDIYNRIVKPGRREQAVRTVQAEHTDYEAEFLSDCKQDT